MNEPHETDTPIANLPAAEIQELCRRLGVAELAVFGSLVRDDFTPDSDIDFLVTFEPGAEKPWMGHFQQLKEELSRLLGRPVDLLDRKALEQSRNWIRRREILGSARVLYAA